MRQTTFAELYAQHATRAAPAATATAPATATVPATATATVPGTATRTRRASDLARIWGAGRTSYEFRAHEVWAHELELAASKS